MTWFTPNLLNTAVPWSKGARIVMTIMIGLLPGWMNAQIACTPDGCRGPNLIPFGNLEFDIVDPGNPSLEFLTDFDYVVCPPANPWDLWGRITLQSNPNNCYNGWGGFDHTYGNGNGTMLLVDFPDANQTKTIWQVDVNVQPNQTYCFGAYYRNLNVGGNVPEPTFRYIVQGSLIGVSPSLPANGNWEYFGFTYTTLPGDSTLTIAIENGTYGGVGNDLAIDDIEFRQIRQAGGSPVAHNDNFVVPGATVTPQYLNLLMNDSSSTGGALNPQMVTLTSSLPTEAGTLTQDSTGLILFTPAAGFLGTASFSYEVCEASGCCAQAVANLSIDNVLPAQIESLRGQQTEQGHLIQWEASHAGALDFFAIETSADGQQFTTIGRVNGKVGTQSYQYMHYKPGLARFYRLRGEDTDGQAFYSVQVEIQSDLTMAPQLIAYPNPVADDLLYVEASNLKEGAAVLELMSRTGQIVWEAQVNPNQGDIMQNIPVGRLPHGLYILRLKAAGHQSLQRIQIQ
ncbi:MAG: Ig-like domain-containing protein, partial [Bacteroidota bacterium]